MTAATSGYGCLFQIDDGANNFTTVAEVTNIDWGGLQTNLGDVTNMDSPGGYSEQIPLIKSHQPIQIDMNFLPANATQGHGGTNGLLKLLADRTKRKGKIVWSNAGASSITVDGYVVNFSATAPVNGVLTGRATFQPLGAPTFA